jgi:broad specificity phosphatase PhoE
LKQQGLDTLTVWTSTLKRTVQTAQYINHHKIQLRLLDEIDAGIFDGWTYEEISERRPEEYSARQSNKLVKLFPFNFRDTVTLTESRI